MLTPSRVRIGSGVWRSLSRQLPRRPVVSTPIKFAFGPTDFRVREYVRKLEAQNAKLQKKIARLESSKLSYKNKVAALRKKLNAKAGK